MYRKCSLFFFAISILCYSINNYPCFVEWCREKDIEPLQYGVDAYIVKKYILGIKDAELAIPDDLNLKGLELEM